MNAAIPERKPATEEISGLIERVTFYNEENDFCVLRVKTPGRREETTCHRLLAVRDRRGMAGRRGLVGQGQRTRAAIQGEHDKDRAAHHGRGDRAIPEQRLGEGDRACSGEEAGR